MQAVGKAASGGRELLRRLRLRPLPNVAAAAAANGSERSASTLSFPSSISTGNDRQEQYPGRGASLSAHDMPLSAAATGTSASASAFVLQLPLRHYSTSGPTLGPRGRSARRGNEKRTRRRRKKSSGDGSRRGGNKPLLRGGRGRRGGGRGGGGNRLDLLPLPSADGGSGGSYDAFGAFSSAGDEYEALYRYGGDTDDGYDDFDGEKRLYYYQTPDEADEANGGGIGDVPPTILSKMESDPTYFHGIEALALHWTTPGTEPPSRDVRVQAVLRDIIQRQKFSATAKKKEGLNMANGGWNGKVVVRIPKTGVDVASGEDGIDDHDDQEGVGTNGNDDDEEEDQGDDTNDEDLAEAPTSGILEDDKQDVGENAETDDTTEENSDESSVAGDKTKSRRTGYNVFTKLRTEQVRESDTDLSPREVREKVLAEWREMTDEEKLVWKAKAEDMAC